MTDKIAIVVLTALLAFQVAGIERLWKLEEKYGWLMEPAWHRRNRRLRIGFFVVGTVTLLLIANTVCRHI